MGSISGGNYISTYSGDQIDGILTKANKYPDTTGASAGQVPVFRNNAIGWENQSGSGGGQSQIVYRQITLVAAGWSNSSQTVTVTGVSATETDQLIQPVPASASRSAYHAAGVQATAQAANSLTFTCATTPSSDLTVYVCITELEAAT